VEQVTLRARPRPDAATRVVDRLKLHRRVMRLDGRPYTVITPRPGTDCRFSTNHFHGTWHILSDWRGARLLGRLLWGLAYQRRAATVILIDRPLLDPNPFDAEPADPILLVPTPLTPFGAKAARELRARLPLTGPSDGTVRWHTHGLDKALATDRARRDAPPCIRQVRMAPPGLQTRIDRIGGLIVWAANPHALKASAPDVYQLGQYAHDGMDYVEVDWPAGEVQVFANYRQRVSAARVARREVLTKLGGAVPEPAEVNPLIWSQATLVRQRRVAHHRPGARAALP
jgi:hypothetical protein